MTGWVPAARPANDAARLVALERYRVLDTAPEPELDELVQLAAELYGTPMAAISLIDDDRQWFKASVGLDICETSRDIAFCAYAILAPEEPLLVADARRDQRFAANPAVLGPPHIRFYAGAPLIGHGGAVLGTLCVMDDAPRRPGSVDLQSLRRLAHQVETLLELRRVISDLMSVSSGGFTPGDADEAGARFALAFERAPVAMSMTSTDGRFLQVNPALCAIIGRDVEDLVGTPVVDVIAAEDRPSEQDLAERLLAGEVPSVVRPGRALRADGSLVDVVRTTSSVRDAEGAVMFFLSQVEDVSHRRQAEAALAMTDHAVEAIVSTDARGRITFWNPGAEAMFGYQASEVVGARVTTIVADRFGDARWTRLVRLAASGKALPGRGTIDVMGRRRDGTELPVELSLARWKQAGGRPFYTAVIRDVTDRKALEDQLERRANVDDLTGLASRACFLDWVSEAGRAPGCSAVVLVDIDRFEIINSSLGQEAGDQVLVGLARRLRDAVGPSDRVARLGGDQFGVLRPDVAGLDEAAELAEVVRAAFARRLAVGHVSIPVSVSAGISLVEPGAEARAVLRQADTALHQAKVDGGNRTARFDQELRRRAVERLDTELGLRRALDDGHLVLHYQPEIDLATGAVAAVEALVRWEHPELGLLPPGRFIPLAEQSGLIVDVGTWVLHAALDQLHSWRRRGLVDVELSVSVNVSSRQLTDSPFLQEVERGLGSRLDPRQLCLEITESTLSDTAAVAVLEELAALGVCIAIDDFGTGYSSFAALSHLPAHQLKIDKSFVDPLGTDPRSAAIVGAVVALADALGLRTVAEGIENPCQLAALRRLGCHWGQGYHFARPLPPASMATMLHPLANRTPAAAGGRR